MHAPNTQYKYQSCPQVRRTRFRKFLHIDSCRQSCGCLGNQVRVHRTMSTDHSHPACCELGAVFSTGLVVVPMPCTAMVRAADIFSFFFSRPEISSFPIVLLGAMYQIRLESELSQSTMKRRCAPGGRTQCTGL